MVHAGCVLLLAFTCVGHKCQDLLSPCDGMHMCTGFADVSQVSHSHDDKLPSPQTKSSPAPANSSAATNTSTTRDSLTARFRKSKHHAHTGKLSSVPRAGTSNQRVVSAVKKVASHTKIRSTTSHVVSNPSKSILKQSCHFKARASSTVGASPVLAVSSSHRSRKRSADAAGLHGAAHGKGEEKQQTAGSVTPGHVTFVAETGGAGEEKTAFRKTPGKSRAEDYMRWVKCVCMCTIEEFCGIKDFER